MTFQQRDNSGSLFKNDRKEKDTHPDRTGTAMIDGKEYYVNGWLKKSGKGEQFLSLSFKEKNGAARTTQPRQQDQHPLREEMEDEIPW